LVYFAADRRHHPSPKLTAALCFSSRLPRLRLEEIDDTNQTNVVAVLT
jgi:hypothetical protein